MQTQAFSRLPTINSIKWTIKCYAIINSVHNRVSLRYSLAVVFCLDAISADQVTVSFIVLLVAPSYSREYHASYRLQRVKVA